MRKGLQGPGVPQWAQITLVLVLVGPWQYQSGSWVVPGIVPSPVPTQYSPPRVHHLPTARLVPAMHRTGASAVTGRLGSTKEILGVDNALPGYWILDTGYWVLVPETWYWFLRLGTGS